MKIKESKNLKVEREFYSLSYFRFLRKLGI